jgi:hypothetical protein
MPGENETWVCDDCRNGRHQCKICEEFGTDDEDVFLCSKPECGRFFHESCLSMQNVEMTLTDPTNAAGTPEQEAAGQVPVFTCPAHHCWTCTEDYIPEEEEEGEEQEQKTPAKTKNRNTKKSSDCSFLQKPVKTLYVSSRGNVMMHCRLHITLG